MCIRYGFGEIVVSEKIKMLNYAYVQIFNTEGVVVAESEIEIHYIEDEGNED